MKKKKTLRIHSHKFSPAHYNSLQAILLNKEIADIDSLSLTKDYYDFDPSLAKLKTDSDVGEVNVHLNSSIKTLFLSVLAKVRGKKNILFLHEPIKCISTKISAYPNFFDKVRLVLIKVVNDALCMFADQLIVFSQNSYLNTPERFVKKTRQLCLPFEDGYLDISNGIKKVKSNKITVSYIGTVANDHAFYEFVQWATESELDRHLVEFRIYTKSTIDPNVLRKIKSRCSVESGRVLTNEEMLAAYRSSTFTWCVYRSANQSGVLPMALMNKSIPLVSRAFGSDLEKYSGCCVLIDDRSVVHLDKQIRLAPLKLGDLQVNARNAFLRYHNAQRFNWKEIFNVR